MIGQGALTPVVLNLLIWQTEDVQIIVKPILTTSLVAQPSHPKCEREVTSGPQNGAESQLNVQIKNSTSLYISSPHSKIHSLVNRITLRLVHMWRSKKLMESFII